MFKFRRTFCSVDEVTGPINLGNPAEVTIRELAEKVVALTGSSSEIVHRALPEDDPVRRCPGTTQARDVLDWAPKVPLDQGLERTIEYFRKVLGTTA